MRICIIGCGYVGSAAAKMWKAAGHEITVTTRHLERAYTLRSLADLVYILSDDWHDLVEKQDVVLLSLAPDSKSDYLETYLHSAEKLLKALPRSQVKKVIYTGSASVYGDHNGEWVTEETPCTPQTANGQILLSTEETLLKAVTPERSVCIFRLGEVYGPGREIVERLRNTHHLFAGTGENYTNLSHLDLILEGLDLAVNQDLNGIYNLCSSQHEKRRDFYARLCEENDINFPGWDPSRQPPHGGNKKIDSSKISKYISLP